MRVSGSNPIIVNTETTQTVTGTPNPTQPAVPGEIPLALAGSVIAALLLVLIVMGVLLFRKKDGTEFP